MKRKCSFASAIISMAMSLLFIGVSILLSIAATSLTGLEIWVFTFGVLVAVFCIAFNACVIPFCKTDEKFRKRLWIVITAFVADILNLVLTTTTVSLFVIQSAPFAFMYIFSLAIITCAILKILDLAKFRNRQNKQKDNSKKISRPLILAASITGMVSALAFLISMIVVFVDTLKLAGDLHLVVKTEEIILKVFEWFLSSALTILFSALTLKVYKASKEKYSKLKALTIIAIILNFALFIINCVNMFDFVEVYLFLAIVYGIVSLASGVLYIVDLCLEGKRSDVQAENKTQDTRPRESVSSAELNSKAETKSEEKNTLQKLEEIKNLRDANAISEEEYEALKAEILKKII